jgi:hypothetical protein
LIAGQSWSLGQPDRILQPETEVRIAAGDDPREHCLSIPTGLNEARFVSAIEFQPGNGAIVHDATVALETKSGCGGSELTKLAYWAPGQSAVRLPEGFGYRLPAGARLALKIRYRGNGEAAADRSRIGLYYAQAGANQAVRRIAIAPSPGASLPANEAAHRAQAAYTLAESAQLLTIRPLLFPLGQSLEATAIRPDGTSEVLIWAKGYRHDWQPDYVFKKPVALPRGARIEVRAYFDNSDDNPNNPNDPPAPVALNGALCEIALASARPARR